MQDKIIKDMSLICGFRGEEAQNEAYRTKHSMLKFPKSRHNKIPAMAVDIYPYPVNLRDIPRFLELAELMFKASDIVLKDKEYKLGWGGNYRSFKDYPHFELVTK
jgi:peptidoglycan L-alanyl-D-glutamate endopeptidase CwlK